MPPSSGCCLLPLQEAMTAEEPPPEPGWDPPEAMQTAAATAETTSAAVGTLSQTPPQQPALEWEQHQQLTHKGATANGAQRPSLGALVVDEEMAAVQAAVSSADAPHMHWGTEATEIVRAAPDTTPHPVAAGLAMTHGSGHGPVATLLSGIPEPLQ